MCLIIPLQNYEKNRSIVPCVGHFKLLVFVLALFCHLKCCYLFDLGEKCNINFYKNVKMSNFALVNLFIQTTASWRQVTTIHTMKSDLFYCVLSVCCFKYLCISRFSGCFSDVGWTRSMHYNVIRRFLWTLQFWNSADSRYLIGILFGGLICLCLCHHSYSVICSSITCLTSLWR